MAWFKIDDNFYDHPKVDELSLEAVGLWVLCGTYCARQLTDGLIPNRRVKRLGGSPEAIAELVGAGLWDEAEDGYQFHDWDEYQPTRDKVEDRRESDRERKRKQRRNENGTFADSDGSHTVTPDGITPESQPESHRPGPSRPDPSPVGGGRRKPEQPLPAGWAPTEAHKAYANEQGVNLDFQAQRFTTWAQAKDVRYRDWDAAFRNWLLKAEKSSTSKNPLWD